MAANVQLQTIRAKARLYADQRVSDGDNAFITDTEIDGLINDHLKEVYDLLVKAKGEDYYITDDTISVVADTVEYSLPADFYQLHTVTLEWGTREHEEVHRLGSLQQRAGFTNWDSWSQYSPKAYRLRGASIEFLPTPKSAVTARLQYIPAFADLEDDADTFDGVNGWEKLVALGVAIEMKEIEEEGSSSRLQLLYDRQYERIQTMVNDRDAEHPDQITNVEPQHVWPERLGRVFLNA